MAIVGRANTMSEPFVLPLRSIGGTPGPKAPAGTLDDMVAWGNSNSAPTSIWEPSSPERVAGFHNNAPLADNGAAVEAPPIERLMGPAPEIMGPN